MHRSSGIVIGLGIAVLIVGLVAYLGDDQQIPTPATIPWGGSPAVVAGLSCPSSGHCVITGAEGVDDDGGPPLAMVTTDEGKTWRVGRLPTTLGDSPITSVSCPTDTACMTVGGGGTVLVSNDGGLTWLRRSRFAVSGQRRSPTISAMECLTATHCLALTGDDAVASTTDDGRTWHLISDVFTRPFPMTATAFDCAGPSTCVVVGTDIGPHLTTVSDVMATSDAGLTWSMVDLPQGLPGNPGDVSCPTALRCLVVTDNLSPVVVAIALNEGHWSTSNEGAVDPGLKLLIDEPGFSDNSIDCTTATRCVVGVGGFLSFEAPADNLTQDGGSVWQSVNFGALSPLDPVCPTPHFCMALDVNSDGFNPDSDPNGVSDAVLTSTDGEESWTVLRPKTLIHPR
jgi:photosystem II stability/assembly factor-like uncharacterized protein